MVIREGQDWVIIKDYVPFRVAILMKEGKVLQALPFLIIDWSADAPINEYYCGMLRSEIVTGILRWVREQFEEFRKINLDDAYRVFLRLLKGGEFPDDEFAQMLKEKYFQLYLICTDHKGNLIQLPYEGSLVDQPFDFVQLYLPFRNAFTKHLEEETKRAQNRARIPSFPRAR